MRIFWSCQRPTSPITLVTWSPVLGLGLPSAGSVSAVSAVMATCSLQTGNISCTRDDELFHFLFTMWSKYFQCLSIQHTVVNVSTLQLQIEVCNKQQQPVSDIIIEIWFSDSLLASFFRTRWKCFHVSGSLVSKLTIYSHPLQESEAVIKHFVLLLFSLKTVKYATQCTAVAALFKWEMELMYLSL